ncbi:MAG: DUF1844 domain-containing protein [Chloroflexota bacterium]
MSDAHDERGPAGPGSGGKDPGFKVIDRRRFSADGEERSEEEPGSEATSEARGVGAGADEAAADATASDPGFVLSDGPSEPGALPEANLSSLFLGLSTQALMHLGEIPDPESGNPDRDLPSARALIDLLSLLRDKTRGNLDAEESHLLDRILYDLRMRYVEISRTPRAPS